MLPALKGNLPGNVHLLILRSTQFKNNINNKFINNNEMIKIMIIIITIIIVMNIDNVRTFQKLAGT